VATSDHPFWGRNVGGSSVDYLETNSILELKDGTSAVVSQVRKILRTTTAGIGWAPDMDEDTGRKIDFRDARVVVSEYDRAQEVDGDLDISSGNDPYLKVRVYNFEVEGTHTYYVGEDAVWVHNCGWAVEGRSIQWAGTSRG